MEKNTNINDLGKIIRDISKKQNILKDISNLCTIIKSLTIPEFDNTVKQNIKSINEFCNKGLQTILTTFSNLTANNIDIAKMRAFSENFSEFSIIISDMFKSLDVINDDNTLYLMYGKDWLEQIEQVNKSLGNVLSGITSIIDKKKNPLFSDPVSLFIIKKKIKHSLNALTDIIYNIKESLVQLNMKLKEIDLKELNESSERVGKLFKSISETITCLITLPLMILKVVSLMPVIKTGMKLFSSIIKSIINPLNKLNDLDTSKISKTIKNINEVIESVIILIKNITLMALYLILITPLLILSITASPIVLLGLQILRLVIKKMVEILSSLEEINVDNISKVIIDIKNLLIQIAILSLLMILIAPIILLGIVASIIVLGCLFVFKIILNSIINTLEEIGSDVEKLKQTQMSIKNVTIILFDLVKLSLLMILIAPIILLGIAASIIILGCLFVFKIVLNSIINTLEEIGGGVKKLKQTQLSIRNITIILFDLTKLSLLMILIAPIILPGVIAGVIILAALFILKFIVSCIIQIITSISSKQLSKGAKVLLKLNKILWLITLVFATMILITPIIALGALAAIVVLIGLTVFTLAVFGMMIVINILKNIVKQIKSKDLLVIAWTFLLVALVVTVFLGVAALLILLQETAKQIDILTIICFILGMIILTVVLALLGALCVSLATVLVPAAIAILLVVAALIIVVASLLLIAYMLNMLGEIKLDTERIRENVGSIMETAAAVISAIFDSVDDKNPAGTSKGFIRVIFEKLMSGSAKLIGAILAIAYLALIIVSVLLISFIAVQLRLLQVLNLDPIKIKQNVSIVLNTAKSVVNSIFDATDDKEDKPSSKGFFTSLLDFCCPQLSAIFNAIMSIGYLALTIVAIFLINFIAIQLRLLQTIDLDSEKIMKNVSIVLDTVKFVVNSIFDATDDKEDKPSSKGFFTSLLDFCCPQLSAIFNAIMAIGYFALAIVAINLISTLANQISQLSKIDLDAELIKQKVSTVLSTANSCIDSIFQPDDTKKQPAEGAIKNILKWVLGDKMVALIDALMSIGYLAIVQTAVGMLGKMARDLTAIAKLPSMVGIDKKVVEIVNASKKVVNSVFNGDVEIGEIKKLSKQANEAEEYLKKLILIPNRLNQISVKLKSINKIDSSVLQKTNKSIQDMLACITAPFEDNKKQLNLSKVNVVLKIVQHMNKMLVMQQKGFDNSNKLLKNYSDFITKIDNTNLAKLQTTVKMFEQMARFSESINGNFDQLAETINEKIAPLLEELKESMSKVAENSDRPTDIQAEKISIKNQMRESGQTRNMTDKEIDNKVNNKYNERQQQMLGIDEITEKLTALINLFQSGEAIVRTS